MTFAVALGLAYLSGWSWTERKYVTPILEMTVATFLVGIEVYDKIFSKI